MLANDKAPPLPTPTDFSTAIGDLLAGYGRVLESAGARAGRQVSELGLELLLTPEGFKIQENYSRTTWNPHDAR
jgi:hypothetical protein